MKIPRWLPYLLGFLTAVGPISTDFYLPAFTIIEAEFHLRHGSAQITLATWFLGFAAGQMMQGAFTDWLGRRRPLIWGTALYAVASLGCAMAPSMGVLALCRFFAAMGGAASSVIPRAIVRDHADGHAAARIMAQLMLVTGVAPILAPTAGGFLLTLMSWRVLFWICTGYGVLGCLLAVLFVPETLPEAQRHEFSAVAVLRRYGGILREPQFAVHAVMSAATMFTIFAFIAGSPALITAYHMSTARMGTLLMFAAAPYILAAQINPRLLAVFGMEAVMRAAVAGALVADIGLFVIARLHPLALPVFMGCVMVNTGSLGLLMPNSNILALSRHPQSAGSASALIGTLTFLSAALCGIVAGRLANGTVAPITEMLLIGSLLIAGTQMLRLWARERKEVPASVVG